MTDYTTHVSYGTVSWVDAVQAAELLIYLA